MTLYDALNIVVKKECLGDFIYDIRERAREDGRLKEGQSSWDHPRVKKFSQAVERLEKELRDLEAIKACKLERKERP